MSDFLDKDEIEVRVQNDSYNITNSYRLYSSLSDDFEFSKQNLDERVLQIFRSEKSSFIMDCCCWGRYGGLPVRRGSGRPRCGLKRGEVLPLHH